MSSRRPSTYKVLVVDCTEQTETFTYYFETDSSTPRALLDKFAEYDVFEDVCFGAGPEECAGLLYDEDDDEEEEDDRGLASADEKNEDIEKYFERMMKPRNKYRPGPGKTPTTFITMVNK